jgi:dipeptidyl aminopeptidase/acylaminoacyl peptidase
MKRREFITLLGNAAVAWPLAARAQQPAIPVVGFIHFAEPSEARELAARFRSGVVQAGFAEGRDVTIAYRWAEGRGDRLPSLIADLLDRNVTAIMAAGPAIAQAVSPDRKRIVTASADKTARLWDTESGKQIDEPLRGHTDNVHTAAFSPDGKRIVTASRDDTARLWDSKTGKQIGELGHEDSVSSAAFSPDGRRIVTASADQTVRLWDTETGEPIGEPLRGHTDIVHSAAFSPDGKRVVTASGDKAARLWKVFANTQEAVWHAKSITPRCLTAAQRKRFVLSAEPGVVHRAGVVALPHHRMETVAKGQAHRQ